MQPGKFFLINGKGHPVELRASLHWRDLKDTLNIELGDTSAVEQKGDWTVGARSRISPAHLECRGGLLFPTDKTAASDLTCSNLRQEGTARGRKYVPLQVVARRCQQTRRS